jgi:hypothetical protein
MSDACLRRRNMMLYLVFVVLSVQVVIEEGVWFSPAQVVVSYPPVVVLLVNSAV